MQLHRRDLIIYRYFRRSAWQGRPAPLIIVFPGHKLPPEGVWGGGCVATYFIV
jgi:hypothetical protein